MPSHAAATRPAIFAGMDFYPAAFNAGTAVVLGALAIPVILKLGGPLLLLVGVTMVVAAAAAGSRYRLSISDAGVELVTLRTWIVPVKRQRWLLDARIELYESLDADAPQGLCVEEPRRARSGGGSGCFGPAREARVRALHRAASEALERFRAAAPACPPELRHAQLASQAALMDVRGAARHPSGRLREVRSLGRVSIGGVEIPPGSAIRFNDEPSVDPRFIDPRRDDLLLEIQVAAPVVVHGRTTNAGAVLRFAGEERPVGTRAAFDDEVEIEGRAVRGGDWLGFRADGRLDAFTLARETPAGGVVLPAGAKLSYWEGTGRWLPARWTCWPGVPLALPQVTLDAGDSCELAPDLSRLTAVSPRRDIVLPQGRLRGGVVPIPVTPDGRVDVAACKKRKLFGL